MSSALIPQLAFELGYQWNCNWRRTLRYSLIYWGSVVRSADQIDLNLDPRNMSTNRPGLPLPRVSRVFRGLSPAQGDERRRQNTDSKRGNTDQRSRDGWHALKRASMARPVTPS